MYTLYFAEKQVLKNWLEVRKRCGLYVQVHFF